MIIRPEMYTMADMFRNISYRTAAIGKWHLGLGDKTGEQDWNAPLPSGLADIGFDYHYIMAATADRVPCVFIEDGKVANYDPEHPIRVDYRRNIPGEPTGKDNPELLYNMRSSHGHDMAIVNGIGRIGYMSGGGKGAVEGREHSRLDHIARHRLHTQQCLSEPFFMYFCTNDVHVPRFPHESFRGKNPMGVRGDAITQFDWSVGEIMRTLDELGIADNTLVILTSDNDYRCSMTAMMTRPRNCSTVTAPQVPVPRQQVQRLRGWHDGAAAIVRWPKGVAGGQESDVLMSHIDWMASLGSLIGARLPEGAAPDSRQRLGNLLGTDITDTPWVVELASNHTLGVRTKDWKYIEPNDGPAMIQWG